MSNDTRHINGQTGPNPDKGLGKLRVSQMPANCDWPFVITPSADDLALMAQDLGIMALRKLRFEGMLGPDGSQGWRLQARLGATVVQSCVITLDPVTTRLEENVSRSYQKDWPGVDPDAEEVEMPQDDTVEPLEDEIDLAQVLHEALALALPAYPRAQQATLETQDFAPPGVVPITDADLKPFAGLAALKDRLEDRDD